MSEQRVAIVCEGEPAKAIEHAGHWHCERCGEYLRNVVDTRPPRLSRDETLRRLIAEQDRDARRWTLGHWTVRPFDDGWMHPRTP